MSKLAAWCVAISLLVHADAWARTDHGEQELRPVRYVIGLSPFMEDENRDPLFRELIRFLLEETPLQSSLWICDAFHLRTICRIDVPNLSAFRSAKTRANQFREPILQLKSFLAARHAPPEMGTLNFTQAVRFPQFMDFVGDHLGSSRHAMVVMVFGSPLYMDEKEPAFSMVQGYYPSDGHLLANRDASVFGLDGRAATLAGMAVHFGWFGDPWVSEAHRQKLERFWSLFLEGQGAQLATFCGDLPTLFGAVSAGATGVDFRRGRYQIDNGQRRVEMLRMTRDVGAADWITRDTLPATPSSPPAITVGAMKIGIRWQGDIDLDLYARPDRLGETLYFENVRSADGYYFKDHRSSPEREYEFIEFEAPVDVWKVESRINFYEGELASGPVGEIRIEFDGKIYSGQFRVEGERGNRGRSGRGQERHWVTIDIPGVLQLRDAGG